MNTKPNHTPTPWEVLRTGGLTDMEITVQTAYGLPVAEMKHCGRAVENAEFICRAVNEHEELVGALEKMLSSFAPGASASVEAYGETSLHSAVRAARTALAKAKGGNTP